jgi:hypothetical protein
LVPAIVHSINATRIVLSECTLGRRAFYGSFRIWVLLWVLVATGAAASPARSAQSTQTVSSAHRLFVFHSGMWINLHHFLYEQAAIAVAGPDGTPHEAELARDESMTSGLSEDERTAWLAAVAYYRANMLQHDLLSDPMMNRLKDRLEDEEGANTFTADDLDAALIDTLNQAAPIYRAHWWPAHDHSNRFWIDAVVPLVDQYGDVISQQIARAFEAAWPDNPLRVDVVAYANFAGSYTTLHPSRVTVSSVDGGNQEVAALEVLFHAAAATIIEQVGASVARSFNAAGKTAPPELPEAILFFTSGYYVQQLYASYTPYADRFAFWSRDDWSGDRSALAKDWQPRLEGKITFDGALAQLAADVGPRARPPAPAPAAAPVPAPSPANTTPAVPPAAPVVSPSTNPGAAPS